MHFSNHWDNMSNISNIQCTFMWIIASPTHSRIRNSMVISYLFCLESDQHVLKRNLSSKLEHDLHDFCTYKYVGESTCAEYEIHH